MENIIVFLGVVNAIFCTLVIFTEKKQKLKAVFVVLIASFIAAAIYFRVLEYLDNKLMNKVVGTWRDATMTDTITFKADGKLANPNGEDFELFDERYDSFEIEEGKKDKLGLYLYRVPDGACKKYPVSVTDNSLKIGTFIFYKIHNQ